MKRCSGSKVVVVKKKGRHYAAPTRFPGVKQLELEHKSRGIAEVVVGRAAIGTERQPVELAKANSPVLLHAGVNSATKRHSETAVAG